MMDAQKFQIGDIVKADNIIGIVTRKLDYLICIDWFMEGGEIRTQYYNDFDTDYNQKLEEDNVWRIYHKYSMGQ